MSNQYDMPEDHLIAATPYPEFRELLIGCGSRRDKILCPDGTRTWRHLTTLDNNPAHDPTIIWDMNIHPLELDNNLFDEIHAYEVLEHLGQQGDYVSFFSLFAELHRILKPNGLLCATVPSWQSLWAWGDPSHTRVINSGSLVFLSQEEYTKQIGKTAMSDFRHIYKVDFKTEWQQDDKETFAFILRAIK